MRRSTDLSNDSGERPRCRTANRSRAWLRYERGVGDNGGLDDAARFALDDESYVDVNLSIRAVPEC